MIFEQIPTWLPFNVNMMKKMESLGGRLLTFGSMEQSPIYKEYNARFEAKYGTLLRPPLCT